MRNEKEKKSITKSVKMSSLQEQQILQKAEEKGMKFSEYMLDSALHGNQGITPCMAVKFQELVNMAMEIADSIDEKDYVRREEFRQKANDLYEFFKPEFTPHEKYDNVENKIGLFIEGGSAIWESLK